MKIELVRLEDIDGKIWHQLFVDGFIKETFLGDDRKNAAIDAFNDYRNRAKEYPKRTVVLSEVIETAPLLPLEVFP